MSLLLNIAKKTGSLAKKAGKAGFRGAKDLTKRGVGATGLTDIPLYKTMEKNYSLEKAKSKDSAFSRDSIEKNREANIRAVESNMQPQQVDGKAGCLSSEAEEDIHTMRKLMEEAKNKDAGKGILDSIESMLGMAGASKLVGRLGTKAIGLGAAGIGALGAGASKLGGLAARGAGSAFGMAKGLASSGAATISEVGSKALSSVSGVGKSIATAGGSLLDAAKTKAGSLAASTGSLAKAGESAAEKGLGKTAEKGLAKVAGKTALKSLVKKIPGIGVLAGLGFGIQRAFAGDFTGAAMEVASGIAGTVPGVGTAASLGIDAALMAKDMSNEGGKNAVKDIEKPKNSDVKKTVEGVVPSSKILTQVDGENSNSGEVSRAVYAVPGQDGVSSGLKNLQSFVSSAMNKDEGIFVRLVDDPLKDQTLKQLRPEQEGPPRPSAPAVPQTPARLENNGSGGTSSRMSDLPKASSREYTPTSDSNRSGRNSATPVARSDAENYNKVRQWNDGTGKAEETANSGRAAMPRNSSPNSSTTSPATSSPKLEQIQPSSPAFSKSAKGTKGFNGFGEGVDGHIKEASEKYGIDEKVLRGFVKMEGGWKGEMSPTGAIGTGQFIQPTWDSLAKSKEGQEIGMSKIGNKFRTADDPRFDKKINTMATSLLAKQNSDALKKAGLEPTGENLYMMHNIGPGVIPALKGENVSAATITAMKHNGMKEGQSPTEFVSMQKSKFNYHYQSANADSVKGASTMAAKPGNNSTVVASSKPTSKFSMDKPEQKLSETVKTVTAEVEEKKSEKSPPVIIQTGSQSQPTQQASGGPIGIGGHMNTRNNESSIRRLTDQKMSYGMV